MIPTIPQHLLLPTQGSEQNVASKDAQELTLVGARYALRDTSAGKFSRL